MSLQLVVIAGPDKGKQFVLNAGGDLMLGRSAQAHYQLSDPHVSRNHCQVLLESDAVTVIDNGGQGGTLVNGKPVKRQRLAPGDVLQLGASQLRVQIGDLPLSTVQAIAGQVATRPSGPQPAATAEKLSSLSGQTL